MAKKTQIAFEIGFQDYVAMMLALISFFSTAFFNPTNFGLYIVSFTLFLSIFLEKRVQALLIVNLLAYLFLYRFFLTDVSDTSALDLLLLNYSGLTSNSFVAFVGTSFLLLIIFLSVISSACIVFKLENQRLLEHVASLSSVVFVILAFTLSLVLAQDVNLGENYQSIYFFASVSFSTNLCFLLRIYLLFTLITNLYYLVFSLIFLSFFAISKVKNKVKFKKPYYQKQALKKNVKNKPKQKEQEQKQEQDKKIIKNQKNKNQKVRGV